MASVLHLLHLILLLVISSKVICHDSEWERTSQGDFKNSVHHPTSSGTFELQAVRGNYLQREASSIIMPSASEFFSSMLDFTVSSLAAQPIVGALFSCVKGMPSCQREHINQQFLAESHNKRSFDHPIARSLLSESGVPPAPQYKIYPPAPQYKNNPPPPSPPNSSSHVEPIVKPPEPGWTPPPPPKRHHLRHHYFAFPPVSSSRRHKAAKSPSLPPYQRLPPSTQPRRSPPRTLPRRLRPPHNGHSTTPSVPPSGHVVAPPPLAPLKGPSSPGYVAPTPSSPDNITPMPLSRAPPTADCGAIICLPPLTKTPFMSPCGCVRPIQVEIQLTVPLYSLFPSISVLAANIADGTVLAPSQVEITGAKADIQDPGYSIVVVNLVPLDQEFDKLTAFLIFQKFWDHEVTLNASLFGNYSVAYVHYPGLPSSPPSQTDTGRLNGTNKNPKQDPFGVDVNQKSHKLGIVIIAVIAFSSAIALVACLGALWFLFFRYTHCESVSLPTKPGLTLARTKRSGGHSLLSSDLGSPTSMSFSSMATYASNARTFTFTELGKATGKFRPENVIGEGGFGRVYSGTLDDGMKVAVKVLKRDQGGKEFTAEVEMLSRLHHRNLVRLIGICTEEHNRCLVYELIPNGSVESHLHGADGELCPLDWGARMKIALGAARGLAYLHEDSNPRVIHRDFKASNILLENDFNPKVSDFGLAKVAPNEGREHLSTRVMGTFGYVAPEYAMTGHLLVKSDVYSYGVVLLELLSGRRPVDQFKPPGQANLVTWARPLLTSTEGLELLVDPALGSNFPFDSLIRVAAIASTCVHPEVSHRPFMGEVVQALKLVYNDFGLQNGTKSSDVSEEDYSLSESVGAGELLVDRRSQYLLDGASFISVDYDSGPSQVADAAAERPLSDSGFFSDSSRFMRHKSRSLGRHNLSGPLRPSLNRLGGYKLQGINKQGSVSEHAAISRHFGMARQGLS
eukprot:c24399_g1_i1 orf=731-3622(-)